MVKYDKKVNTCAELLEEFGNLKYKDNSSLIQLNTLMNDKDVYNITAPFEFEGSLYIAGRTEARDSENSEVIFFKKDGHQWCADVTIPKLKLQDPFITRFKDLYIVGGVEIFEDENCHVKLNYRTVFYRGKSLRYLEMFAKGPDKMKDIRLCLLPDQRILVMTRPQGNDQLTDDGKIQVGSRGKIGYLIIDYLEELTPENILKAQILEHMFVPEEWGGCNEMHVLKNGKIGVLAHIACYDEKGDRHYYSTTFCFDYMTGDYSPMKMIAVRNNFQDGPAKRDDLKDVIFSGGIVRLENHKACLYCGVSDTQGHRIIIDDPFVPYEI